MIVTFFMVILDKMMWFQFLGTSIYIASGRYWSYSRLVMKKFTRLQAVLIFLAITIYFLPGCGGDSKETTTPVDQVDSRSRPTPSSVIVVGTPSSSALAPIQVPIDTPTPKPTAKAIVPSPTSEVAEDVDPISVGDVLASLDTALAEGYAYKSDLSMSMTVSFGEFKQEVPLAMEGDVSRGGDFQGRIDVSSSDTPQLMEVRVIDERAFILFPGTDRWFEQPPLSSGQKTINPSAIISAIRSNIVDVVYVGPEIMGGVPSHHVRAGLNASSIGHLVPLLTGATGDVEANLWVEVGTGRLAHLSMEGSVEGGPEVRGPSDEELAISIEVNMSARDFGEEVTIEIPELPPSPADMSWTSAPEMQLEEGKDYKATIKIYGSGEIILDLLEVEAPVTVNNFVFLANEGYYDGITFHRVIPGFMAQGGDPTGTGSGGPGYMFENEFHTDARHDGAGVLSMANSGMQGGKGTNGSQFFITFRETSFLDGLNADGSQKDCSIQGTSCHSVFGRVIEGMDVLESITPRDPSQGGPSDVMESVTISAE